MNVLTSILLFSLQTSILDYARSIEAALREAQTTNVLSVKTTITEKAGSKTSIVNLPAKTIETEITISVTDNNSIVTKMTVEQAKETLLTAHREIMRQALLDATHD